MAIATQERLVTSDEHDHLRQASKEDPDPRLRSYRRDQLARVKARAALAEAQGLTPDCIPYACAPAKAGVIVSVRDEDDGQWTTLRSDVGQWKTAGEAIGLATAGPHLVALRTLGGVAVVDLSREAVLVSFSAWPHVPLLMAADRDVAIIHHNKSLVIVLASGNITRLPLPHPPEPQVPQPTKESGHDPLFPPRGWGDDDGSSALLAITPSSFVVTAGGRRIAIARASVAVGPPGLITLDALSIAPPTEARIDQQERADAGVSSGGLLGASEVRPGFGAPAPESLDPSRLEPLDPYPEPSNANKFTDWDDWDDDDVPSSDSELGGADAVDQLVSFAEAIGLQPSSLVWRYLCWQATDRSFERSSGNIWYPKPSLEYPGRFLIDPCLFILYSEGIHLLWGIYDYPPARAAGHAIVFCDPYGYSIEWEASSFDAQLAIWIAEAAFERATEAGFIHPFRVLRMLGLPPAFLDVHPKSAPPSWFEAAHPRLPYSPHPPDLQEPLVRGDEARVRGDWIAAERAYVRALHVAGARSDETAQETIAARLADVYAALGWLVHERRMRGR